MTKEIRAAYDTALAAQAPHDALVALLRKAQDKNDVVLQDPQLPRLAPGTTSYVKELSDWLKKDPKEFAAKFRTALQHETPEMRAGICGALEMFNMARNGEKLLPFVAPLTEEQVAKHYGMDGMDVGLAREALAAIEENDVTAALQNRMGTDVDLPVPEPTLGDEIGAAYDVLEAATRMAQGE